MFENKGEHNTQVIHYSLVLNMRGPAFVVLQDDELDPPVLVVSRSVPVYANTAQHASKSIKVYSLQL
jgi:penicillin-binding protein-related factor A (putative recombinase)